MKKVLCLACTAVVLLFFLFEGVLAAENGVAADTLTVDESKAAELTVTPEEGGVFTMTDESGVVVRITMPGTCVGEESAYTIAPVSGTPIGDEDEIVKGFSLAKQGANGSHVQLEDPAMISFIFAEDPGTDLTIARYGDTLESCEPVDTYMAYENGAWVAYALVDGFSAYGVVRPQAGWYRTPTPTGFTEVISFDEIVWSTEGSGFPCQVHLRMKLFRDYEPRTAEQLAAWIQEYIGGNKDYMETYRGVIMMRFTYEDKYGHTTSDYIADDVEITIGNARYGENGASSEITYTMQGFIAVSYDPPDTHIWDTGTKFASPLRLYNWDPDSGTVCASVIPREMPQPAEFITGKVFTTRQSSQAAEAELQPFVGAEGGAPGGP